MASETKSKSARVGLVFPVARVSRHMRKGGFAPRISLSAGIYMTAVLEHVAHDILKRSSDVAHDNDKQRITPRFLMLTMSNDAELKRLIGNQTAFVSGGIVPTVHSRKRASAAADSGAKKKKKGTGKKVKKVVADGDVEEEVTAEDVE